MQQILAANFCHSSCITHHRPCCLFCRNAVSLCTAVWSCIHRCIAGSMLCVTMHLIYSLSYGTACTVRVIDSRSMPVTRASSLTSIDCSREQCLVWVQIACVIQQIQGRPLWRSWSACLTASSVTHQRQVRCYMPLHFCACHGTS